MVHPNQIRGSNGGTKSTKITKPTKPILAQSGLIWVILIYGDGNLKGLKAGKEKDSTRLL